MKVGGTSVEVALSQVLPDNAIVTEITPSNPFHTPRNHDGFYNHMPLTEIKEKINLKNVSKYTIVRNPYDTVFSFFIYRSHLLNEEVTLNNIEEKLKQHFDNKDFLKSTKNIYLDKDNNIDKFLYYENGLESEINSILINHNIDTIKLNFYEKKLKPDWADRKQLFTKNFIDIINKEWDWEFNNLGYEKE